MQTRWLLLAALAVTAVGCGGNKNKFIRRQAASDLTCAEGQVRLTTVSRNEAQYRAEGCGRFALYTYTKREGVLRISAIEGVGNSPPVVVPPPTTANPQPPGAPPPPPPPPPPL